MASHFKQSIIVTLMLDDASQKYLDEKRKQYYPAYANFVAAHVTLFYKLPIENETITKTLNTLTKINSFDVAIVNIKHIEKFLAYEVSSNTLQLLHAKLQATFLEWLNYKDKQLLWPHVTIQNKATSYKAFKTHQHLMSTFKPFTISAIGVSCWLYANKSWVKKEDILFNN